MRVTFRDNVEDRAISGERHVLVEARRFQRRLTPDRTGIRLQLAVHDSEKRRLAGAVAPDHGDALAGVDLERDAVEQRQMAECDRNPIERNERHAAKRTTATLAFRPAGA